MGSILTRRAIRSEKVLDNVGVKIQFDVGSSRPFDGIRTTRLCTSFNLPGLLTHQFLQQFQPLAIFHTHVEINKYINVLRDNLAWYWKGL